MAGRLQGKVAFVTGGGSGIGAATALRFAQEGATVVICGRRREPLDEVAGRIRAAGGQAEVVQADVGHESQIVGAIEEALERKGRGEATELLGAYLDQTREVFDHALRFQRELFTELRALKGAS